LLLFFKSVSTIADVAGCRGFLTLKTAVVTDLLLFILPFPRFWHKEMARTQRAPILGTAKRLPRKHAKPRRAAGFLGGQEIRGFGWAL
jgi:hypothetical protein